MPGYPRKVVQIEQDPSGVRLAKADFGGLLKQVSLEYLPEAQCGDYVLVHVGFALSLVSAEEAERVSRALEDMRDGERLEPPDMTSSEFTRGRRAA